MKPTADRWRRVLLWAALGLGLLAVFGLYTRPDFLLLLADQLWACL